MSEYSDKFESSDHRSFVKLEECYYDKNFNIDLLMQPVGNTFFDARESCSSKINKTFEERALFTLKILYKVYVMHQMSIAHCNINLRSFRYSADFSSFYLTDFGAYFTFRGLDKRQCAKNPGYEPPEEYIDPPKEEPDFLFEQITAGFQYDAFAVGKVLLEMGVTGDIYKKITATYDKFVQAEAMRQSHRQNPLPTLDWNAKQEEKDALWQQILKRANDVENLETEAKKGFYEDVNIW